MGEIRNEEAEREAIGANWAKQSHRAHELGIKQGATPYKEGQKSTDENPRSLEQLAKDFEGILNIFESQKKVAQAAITQAEERHAATRFNKE